jgi:hypothetical protein
MTASGACVAAAVVSIGSEPPIIDMDGSIAQGGPVFVLCFEDRDWVCEPVPLLLQAL